MDRDTYNRLLADVRRLAVWTKAKPISRWDHLEADLCAVYKIFSRERGGVVYIGRTTDLRRRIRDYATGLDPTRPPVFQIVQEYMEKMDEYTLRNYHSLDPRLQRGWRQMMMAESNLMYRAAIVQNAEDAAKLEGHLIRLYKDHGAPLWNHIQYKEGLAFPPPPERSKKRKGQRPILNLN